MKNAFLAVSVVALLVNQASATVWWDPINGTTAGTGSATPSGTWSTSVAAWGNTGGTAAPAVYGADTTVRFAAGADATGAYTVTVGGTVNVTILGMEEGTVTFTGGTINFIHAANSTSVLTGIAGGTANTTAIFESQLTGTGGFRVARSTVAGTQIAVISNTSNTLTGNFQTNSGTTLRLGASGVIPDSNLVRFDTTAAASTFDVNGQTETIKSLILSGGTTAPLVTLGAGTLILNDPAGEVFNGVISGATGNFTKNGSGTFTTTAQNTYTGTTTIGAGTLQVGNNGTTGQLGNSSGAIVNDGTLVFHRSNDNTHSGGISGTGSLTKFGAGTLSLTNGAGNTYTGDTTISAGRISVSGTSEIGTGTLILAGGTLNTTASRSVTAEPISNAINVTAPGRNYDDKRGGSAPVESDSYFHRRQ